MTAQLDSTSFRVARRGYDRAEVDDRFAAPTTELSSLAADAGDGAPADADRGPAGSRPSPAARHALTRVPNGQAGARR